MENVIIKRWGVNVEALDGEIRTALGEKAVGISTGPYGVVVHLEGADGDDVAAAINLVKEHDSAVLTDEQKAEVDELAALEEAREANVTALDVTVYASEAKAIQDLAAKVAWLEKEINALQRS